MRQIEFVNVAPSYCPAGPSLQCPVHVDGSLASYGITAEALEDHFGARSYQFEDLMAAYERHKPHIESVARSLFELTGARNVVLHSGHFRFAL
jgi:hypothetical protein